MTDLAGTGLSFADEGWTVVLTEATTAGSDTAAAAWADTLFALSNGTLGVRGANEERAHATTVMAHAYEQSPIRYHERLSGFADRTDTRVPVVETLTTEVTIDGQPIDFNDATATTVRRLDLHSGVLQRETRWRLNDGRTLTIASERLVPLDGRALLLRRLRAESDVGRVALRPFLSPAPAPVRPSGDPRLGVELAGGGFATERCEPELVIERLQGSGIGVAAVQRVKVTGDALLVATGLAAGRETAEVLCADAAALADTSVGDGFDAAVVAQRAILDDFWAGAAIAVDGDAQLTGTLRLNLFHLFASSGRDGRSSAAAKGLTGEGYEGHYFWDTEAFMVPVLAVLAPDVARAMLVYRSRTLAAARANARALNHERGVLYAWRTIAGRECSAHYPSGSAQYHINAAIAFAIGCYLDATGDEAFLVEHGAELLVETARLWLVLGDWQDGAFHLRGVTGPDEYTALIDDNWYTNRMAQRHLRQTIAAVAEVARIAPEARVMLDAKLGLDSDELAAFARAADAMHLPYDVARGLDAQDASFLDKPRWDLKGTPRERFPLLLHHHPLTLYRHQVAKQADLVLGLVLAGEDVPPARKRRAFDHYDAVTAHDSTLSAATFAILATEVGLEARALDFLAEAAFVDVEDRHGNTGHGVHMAALAGSWLAVVWGFGGFRPTGATLRLRPTRPAAWGGYTFGMLWRGTRLRVVIVGDTVTYRAIGGPDITFHHHDRTITLAAGAEWSGPLAGGA